MAARPSTGFDFLSEGLPPDGTEAGWQAFYDTEMGYQFGWGDLLFAALLVDMHSRGLLGLDPVPQAPPWQDFRRWLVSRP